MLPLHTCQTINPLKNRYIVLKYGSVWKLIEKWSHKINTCLLNKLIRIVLLLLLFQKHSPSIYFSHLLSHPHKKPVSSFIWPTPTLLFTLANSECRKYSADCGCNHSSQLNACWTFVVWVFLNFFSLTLRPSTCSVLSSKKLKNKENFVQNLVLMCSSLAFCSTSKS